MSYQIKSGDTLWKIVKDQFGLTNNTEIANMVNKIAKENHISNQNSIMAGKSLNLPSVSKNESIFTAAKATAAAVTPKLAAPAIEQLAVEKPSQAVPGIVLPAQGAYEAQAPAAKTKDDEYTDWTVEAANKYSNGETIQDFAFVGDDYKNDIINNGGKNAAQIYKKGLADLSSSTIAAGDTNHDGKLSYKEYAAKEKADYMKDYPDTDKSLFETKEAKRSTKQGFRIIDTDNDKHISLKEMETFYAVLDSTGQQGSINGKISQDGFVTLTSQLGRKGNEKALEKRFATFNKFLSGQE